MTVLLKNRGPGPYSRTLQENWIVYIKYVVHMAIRVNGGKVMGALPLRENIRQEEYNH